MAAPLTTSWGAPVDDNDNSLTVGPNGPILLQDTALIDKLAHFDRERIPERVVHAKGAGAHGYFEVTHDITRFSKAKVFSKVGKRTPIFARFSTVGGERGSADTARDPRGFSIKHYTEDGIWDMVGNNTPIFFVRDPILFPDFIHTQKRHAQTNLKDADAVWDFVSQHPESIHQFSFLFSDRGTPDGFRHMHGFSSHTYKMVNAAGEAVWVKLHYKTTAGVKNLMADEAQRLEGVDPDYATRDLFEHIEKGNTAEWEVCAQFIPIEEGINYKYNIFDVTKTVSQKDYPLQPIGRMVLNRNPQNYFAEVEQSAFAPAHLVPGIEPSPDRMLQGRLFSYVDTHRHRLGANYLQIPINCPYASKVTNQQRDGVAVVNGNGGAAPNYWPNTHAKTLHNPEVVPSAKLSPFSVQGVVGRGVQQHPNCDFEQPGIFFRLVLNADERQRLVENIVGSLSGARKEVQARMVEIFTRCDVNYGKMVAEGLKRKANL